MKTTGNDIALGQRSTLDYTRISKPTESGSYVTGADFHLSKSLMGGRDKGENEG